MPDLAIHSKRKRTYRGKTTTGCITCRIRRIKCDEEKPACRRCTGTGRRCDGYASNTLPSPSNNHGDSRDSPTRHDIIVSPTVGFPGTDKERRSLHFFYSRSAPILSGYFDFDFWNRLLLQLSHSEPVLRHAMIAVSVMHERSEALSKQPLIRDDQRVDDRHRFALQQYNKAISQLGSQLASKNSSIEVTLICCVLFICLELLQHNGVQAFIHMQSGLKILNSLQPDGQRWTLRKNATRLLSESSVDSSVLEKSLTYIFTRLDSQSTLFGRPSATFRPKSSADRLGSAEPEPVIFVNIVDARNAMDVLMHESTRFVLEATMSKDSNGNANALKAKQTSLQLKLEHWQAALEPLISQLQESSTYLEAISLLQIHQRGTQLWVSTCLSTKEITYDHYFSDFEAIISMAESLEEGSRTIQHSFSFEMGLIPTLYFVALKCRHPILRRRAVALLAARPRQEALWDSQRSASVATRVIDIEEAGANIPSVRTSKGRGNGEGKGKGRDGLFLPPESARVQGAVTSSTVLYKPRRSRVTFIKKPNGPHGEHVSWQEEIRW